MAKSIALEISYTRPKAGSDKSDILDAYIKDIMSGIPCRSLRVKELYKVFKSNYRRID